MGRHIDKQHLGPAAVCDACGATAHSLHMDGMSCYRRDCPGVMQHRSLWRFAWWPDGTMTATPRDDLTAGEVAAIHAEQDARRIANDTPR